MKGPGSLPEPGMPADRAATTTAREKATRWEETAPLSCRDEQKCGIYLRPLKTVATQEKHLRHSFLLTTKVSVRCSTSHCCPCVLEYLNTQPASSLSYLIQIRSLKRENLYVSIDSSPAIFTQQSLSVLALFPPTDICAVFMEQQHGDECF